MAAQLKTLGKMTRSQLGKRSDLSGHSLVASLLQVLLFHISLW